MTRLALSRASKSAMVASGRSATALSMLAIAAVLSRVLSRYDYATVQQTLVVYIFLSPFLKLGLPEVLYYFLGRDKKNARSILSGNLLILFSSGLLFMIFLWAGGNRLIAGRFNNQAISDTLLIFAPYAMFALPMTAISACLVSYGKTRLLAIFNVASGAILIAFVGTAAYSLRTPEASVIGFVAATALASFAAVILMYRSVEGVEWRPVKSNIQEQLKISVPMGIAATLGVMAINLDKVLVSSLCPPEDFAIYINGAFQIPVLYIISGSVMAVLLSEFATMFKEGKTTEMVAIWKSAMLKCSYMIIPLMFFLFLMAPELMGVLFSPEYQDSATPFRIYLLLLPVRITSFGSIILAAGKSNWILKVTLIAVIINFIASIFLIKQIGYLGAAIATVLTTYLWTVPYYISMIKKLTGFSRYQLLPIRALGKVIVISGVPILVCWILKRIFTNLHDITLLGINGCVYCLLVILIMMQTGLVKPGEVIKGIKKLIP